MRAIREREEIVDWELLYANDFVRERWLGMLPAPGTRASDDGMLFLLPQELKDLQHEYSHELSARTPEEHL